MEIGRRYNLVSVLDGNTRVWVHTCSRIINGKHFLFLIENGNVLVQEETPGEWDQYESVMKIRHYIPKA